MRNTALILLAIPLLGAKLHLLEDVQAAELSAPEDSSSVPEPEELFAIPPSATSERVLAEPLTRETPTIAAPLSTTKAITAPVPLPLLPVNPLLEVDASPERYAEWYAGTPIELLYQSLVRLKSLRSWDPGTCACRDTDLLSRHAETHDRVHALNKQDKLLLHEEAWLRSEVRRQVSADLEKGGSLQVFRLPSSEAQLSEALEKRSTEELKILDQLLRDARGAVRRAAVEAEFAAGNFKVGAHGVWG